MVGQCSTISLAGCSSKRTTSVCNGANVKKVTSMHQKREREEDIRLIVLGFNDTSALVGHFVSFTRERENTGNEFFSLSLTKVKIALSLRNVLKLNPAVRSVK